MNPFSYTSPPLRLGLFDLGGVLYHANYFALFEQAREAFLAAHGTPYSELSDCGTHLAIVESHQDFLKPVRYGDTVEVALSTRNIRRSSFVFDYQLFVKSSGMLAQVPAHRAWTRMVYVESRSGTLKTGRLPEKLLSTLKQVS